MTRKRLSFSKRIVLVYTLIVAIPLILLMPLVFSVVLKQSYAQLRDDCLRIASANALRIQRNMETFDTIEQIIGGNYELMRLLRTPEKLSGEERIQTLLSETEEFERILSVIPNIYGIRVFVNSPLIPERWPVILSQARTDLYSLKRWEYNYTADYLGNMTHLSDPSVCSTRNLKHYGSSVGYLQITMRMQDFFPFLYEDKSPFISDYVYLVNEADAGGGSGVS